jgi:HD-GYP domain-containing protein (c-di-GMP phosphodiesterase class II)
MLGIPLPWSVRDAQGLLLLSRGYILTSESQLNQILERGAFVDVEEIKAAAAHVVASPSAPTMVAPPNLFDLWNKTAEALRVLLTRPLGNPEFRSQLDAFAVRVVTLLDRNINIGIYRAVRQDNAQDFYYGYTHSIHTAVLCILLSRHLCWPEDRMMSLVRAALTMNMSILELQGKMAAQDVPIKDSQRTEIRNHPQKAVELLQKLGVTDTAWLQAIAQHHEHPEGTGYPSGCKNMSEMAMALRVTDIFMAKISPRALRPALTPQEAIRHLYKEDQGGALSTAVVKEFGIYPPGDFVKLASGEFGIVVERTANAKAPIVAAITDVAGKAIVRTVRHDTAQAQFAIVGIGSDKAMLRRLPPERLYGFAAAVPVG